MAKDFSKVTQAISTATAEPPKAKRGRPRENDANGTNGRHLTLYVTDEQYNYIDSMSRITHRSKAQYLCDLIEHDKDERSGLYMQVLELQKKF